MSQPNSLRTGFGAGLRARTCLSCGDRKPYTEEEFPTGPPTSNCDHAIETCRECLQTWIAAQLEINSHEYMQCPQCPELLHTEDVRRHASEDTLAEYYRREARHAMSGVEDFFWCLNPDCSSGQLHPGGADEPIFRCHACQHRSCVVCSRPWHPGEMCSAIQAAAEAVTIRQQEEQSEALVLRTSKACPNPTCLMPIEKRSGCDHMTCTRCFTEFCYECRADYGGQNGIHRVGNAAHLETCMHYRVEGVLEDADPLAWEEEGTYDEIDDEIDDIALPVQHNARSPSPDDQLFVRDIPPAARVAAQANGNLDNDRDRARVRVRVREHTRRFPEPDRMRVNERARVLDRGLVRVRAHTRRRPRPRSNTPVEDAARTGGPFAEFPELIGIPA